VRRSPGTDHRPDVLQAHRRHRALAVPTGAQARRPPAQWLANRLPLSASHVGQPGQALRFRLRPARAGRKAIAAGLRAVHRTLARRAGDAALSSGAADGTLITAGQGVNDLVLSGGLGLVLSGVSLSCY